MVFDDGPADALTVLLVQLEQEILGSYSTVLRVVVDITESRVKENLHKASELFLADAVLRDDFSHRLEEVLLHGGGVLEVVDKAKISKRH